VFTQSVSLSRLTYFIDLNTMFKLRGFSISYRLSTRDRKEIKCLLEVNTQKENHFFIDYEKLLLS
jgi:hypothetical protein